MNRRLAVLLTGGVLTALAAGWLAEHHAPPARAGAQPPQATAPMPRRGAPPRQADEQAVRKSAHEFVRAFNHGDARALASLWAEHGEYYDDHGTVLRGRAAIELAYAQLFQHKPGTRVDVQIQSIRFPSRDIAVEEGTIRVQGPGREPPATTLYGAVDVREDGRWETAVVHEWGADADKLADLDWLIGQWVGTTKSGEVRMSFAWNSKKTIIRGKFSTTEHGRVVAEGTQTIGVDPRTGRLRSWTIDEDGGHGESLWYRDGNRWISESTGVVPGGAEIASVNVITRLDDNQFVWRSTNRHLGPDDLPDTDPIKVTRVRAAR